MSECTAVSPKLFIRFLVLALLVLAGYLALRLSLPSPVQKQPQKSGQSVSDFDTLGGKKVSVVDLRPLFLQRLQQVLSRSSKGLYRLSVGDLEVDVLRSTLLLRDVKMEPDKAALDSLKKAGDLPENVFAVSLAALSVDGVNLDDVITRKTMDYRSIKLVKPTIVLHRQKAKEEKEAAQNEDFAQRFLKDMKLLTVKKIEIVDGDLTVYNDRKPGKPLRIKNLSVLLNDLRIDSATRKEKDRFLFAKEAVLRFRHFSKPTPDGLYNLRVGEVTVRAPQDVVTLADFSFASPLTRRQFVRRQKQSKELYNLRLSSVVLKGVDWWALLNEEAMTADDLDAAGGTLSVYLDRSLPPRNKMGNFPGQLLMKLPLKLSVRNAVVRNLNLRYSEYSPLSGQTGTVSFDNVRLAVTNLSNLPVANPKPLVVGGTALFMHTVPLQARFVFNRKEHRSGAFSAYIKTKGFDGRLLNSFSEPMGLLRVDKGLLQSTEATLSGNERQASGEVFVPYTGLKISLLEKDGGKTTLDKKDATSFLANLLLLKNDNPKNGEKPRREKAAFVRQPEGGFLMLVWKTMLVGVLKTIGAPEKIAYKKPPAAKSR